MPHFKGCRARPVGVGMESKNGRPAFGGQNPARSDRSGEIRYCAGQKGPTRRQLRERRRMGPPSALRGGMRRPNPSSPLFLPLRRWRFDASQYGVRPSHPPQGPQNARFSNRWRSRLRRRVQGYVYASGRPATDRERHKTSSFRIVASSTRYCSPGKFSYRAQPKAAA